KRSASACDSRPTPQPKSSASPRARGSPSSSAWRISSAISRSPLSKNSSSRQGSVRPGSTRIAPSGSLRPSSSQLRTSPRRPEELSSLAIGLTLGAAAASASADDDDAADPVAPTRVAADDGSDVQPAERRRRQHGAPGAVEPGANRGEEREALPVVRLQDDARAGPRRGGRDGDAAAGDSHRDAREDLHLPHRARRPPGGRAVGGGADGARDEGVPAVGARTVDGDGRPAASGRSALERH